MPPTGTVILGIIRLACLPANLMTRYYLAIVMMYTAHFTCERLLQRNL